MNSVPINWGSTCTSISFDDNAMAFERQEFYPINSISKKNAMAICLMG